MTFEDLPENAKYLPMTEAQLRADMVDLILGSGDRSLGCVGVWLCDEGLLARQPVVVSECGEVTPHQVRQILGSVLEVAIGPVFVALGRLGSPLFTLGDRQFAREVERVCAERGVACLGTYVATPDVVRELPEHLRMAS